jgi:hypothetical protein
LTLVEIDRWGDAARQITDSLFPWLAHRSNEELARLFDIIMESENATTTTLRLTFPGGTDTYLRVSLAKQTGEPVNWRSVVAGETMYELQFTPRAITAVDGAGKELERWELMTDVATAAIPPLDKEWGDFFVVEPSKSDAPLQMARQAFRQGKFNVAEAILGKLRSEFPQQPLVNFFYAWSIRFPELPNPDQIRSQREALARVAAAGPADLLSLVTPGNFPSLGLEGLRETFLSVPAGRRTPDLWESLSNLAVALNRSDLALEEIDRALAGSVDNAKTLRRQKTRVELLLTNGRPFEADAAAKLIAANVTSPDQLLEIGEMFVQAERHEMASFYFDRYRSSPGISRLEQIQSWIRQGLTGKSNENRWRALIALVVDFGEHPSLIDGVLTEAHDAQDGVVLGNLADELKPGPIQTRLLLRKLRLVSPKLQADVALRLLKENQLPDADLDFVSKLFEYENRQTEAIEIIERQLKKGELVSEPVLQLLGSAYRKLNRNTDYERVISGADEREVFRKTSPPPRRNPPVVGNHPGVGGGFFNVP